MSPPKAQIFSEPVRSPLKALLSFEKLTSTTLDINMEM